MKITKQRLKEIIKEELENVLERFDQNSFPGNVVDKIRDQLKSADPNEANAIADKMLANFPDIEGNLTQYGIEFGEGQLQDMIYIVTRYTSKYENIFNLDPSSKKLVIRGETFHKLGVEQQDKSGSGFVKKFLELQQAGKIPSVVKLSQNTMRYAEK